MNRHGIKTKKFTGSTNAMKFYRAMLRKYSTSLTLITCGYDSRVKSYVVTWSFVKR